MSIALLIARFLLALVFVVAGLTKLADRAGSRQALLDFGVPAPLATPGGILLPLAELAVALALIPLVSAWWGALGALALVLLFIAGIAFNLARGRTPDCHCFGQLYSKPIGRSTPDGPSQQGCSDTRNTGARLPSHPGAACPASL